MLNDLALVFRFGVIFKKHFKGKFRKSNEHLWWHVGMELANCQTPTDKWDMGMHFNVLMTGSHLRMLLYKLNELFYMYRGVGENDTDRQCVVVYEILKVVSLCCMERHGSKKEESNTLGAAYPKVNLSDVDGLEHLAWAVYDGVYVPGNLPDLTGCHWDQ